MTEGPLGFIFGGGEPPEELKAAIQAQMDRQDMGEQAYRHDLNRLWKELKPEQLATVRRLINRLGRLEEPHAALAFYEGIIVTHLEIIHNVCSGCGVNHDEQLDPSAFTAAPAETVPGGTLGKEEVDKLNGGNVEGPNRADALAIYNVREPNDQDLVDGLVMAEGERPVLCKNCNMLYQSLDDRMLRRSGPEGCEGCVHKAKWG